MPYNRDKRIATDIREFFQRLRDEQRYHASEDTIKDAINMAINLVKGRDLKGFSSGLDTSSIYLACEKCACPIPLQKAKRLTGSYNPSFNFFLKELRQKYNILYPMKPEHWKAGLFRRLKNQGIIDESSEKPLCESFDNLCARYGEIEVKHASHASRFIAIALLYLSAIQCNFKLTQAKLTELFMLSSTTIKKISCTLIERLNLDVEQDRVLHEKSFFNPRMNRLRG